MLKAPPGAGLSVLPQDLATTLSLGGPQARGAGTQARGLRDTRHCDTTSLLPGSWLRR